MKCKLFSFWLLFKILTGPHVHIIQNIQLRQIHASCNSFAFFTVWLCRHRKQHMHVTVTLHYWLLLKHDTNVLCFIRTARICSFHLPACEEVEMHSETIQYIPIVLVWIHGVLKSVQEVICCTFRAHHTVTLSDGMSMICCFVSKCVWRLRDVN